MHIVQTNHLYQSQLKNVVKVIISNQGWILPSSYILIPDYSQSQLYSNTFVIPAGLAGIFKSKQCVYDKACVQLGWVDFGNDEEVFA